MAIQEFSTDHLDYLQRYNSELPPLPRGAPVTSAPLERRRLWRVMGVGHETSAGGRDMLSMRVAASPAGTASGDGTPSVRLSTEDVLIGLAGLSIPVAFAIKGDAHGIEVWLGTWSQLERENPPPAVLDSRQQVIATVLSGLYPALELEPVANPVTPPLPLVGAALGVPTIKGSGAGGGILPYDRLVRAMPTIPWAAVVLAEPVSARVLGDHRDALLNEVRAVQAAVEAARSPSPLARHYTELLEGALSSVVEAHATGAWRTAVYLLGNEVSYYRLASLWRSIFSGERSLPEPVRIWESRDAGDLAAAWALPDQPGPTPPGHVRLPFAYQTLLTSSQLAAYVHLPSVEAVGFQVEQIPGYDLVPPHVDGKSVTLGSVIDRSRVTETPYAVAIDDLSRHALVAGVTGSGKTNTVFQVIGSLWTQHKVPFLVLEPAKAEYRSLLAVPAMASELRVFTLGDERTSPLRINPFEVEGVSVVTHLDLLKSVFNASFGMWNPLPQVLERCLHAVYRDYGWDPVRNINRRLDAQSGHGELAFPTLSDLHDKVEEVVRTLDYEARIAGDIRAALLTRINGLRIGSKGAMLDTQHSIPITTLLEKPTIVELEAIGDDDEKAFLMGLLLIRIYEHLRAGGSVEDAGLRHLLVVEEAHRLLANVQAANREEQSTARSQAVETFSNMLSEIRAYGQGVIVAEQIPTKLAPDVIKNTNLKVIHRVVAADDREVLGGTMNMDVDQCAMVGTLKVGQAAVFAEGDDRPILVSVPYAKVQTPSEMAVRAESDKVVAQAMQAVRSMPTVADSFAPYPECPPLCGEPYRYCDAARELVADAEFRRLFMALVLRVITGGLAGSAAERLERHIRARMPMGVDDSGIPCVVMNAASWYLAFVGREYGWPYATAAVLRAPLIGALLAAMPSALAGERAFEVASDTAQVLQSQYRRACERSVDPFPACSQICPGLECLFRYQAELLVQDEHLKDLFVTAIGHAATGVWDDFRASDQAAMSIVGSDADAAAQRRAGLCYAQQQLAFLPGLAERQVALDRLLTGYAQRERPRSDRLPSRPAPPTSSVSETTPLDTPSRVRLKKGADG